MKPFEGTEAYKAGFEDGRKLGWLKHYSDGYEDGYKAGKSKWIPCSERTPEDGETVLVLFDDGDMAILTFPNIYKRLNRVAWMALPEPPEEVE